MNEDHKLRAGDYARLADFQGLVVQIVDVGAFVCRARGDALGATPFTVFPHQCRRLTPLEVLATSLDSAP